MRTETMTPRERWLAVLQGQTPDRVPMDYWATDEATAKLLQHLGCDETEMCRRLHIDRPLSPGPAYVGPSPKPGEDIWGIRRQSVAYGTGVYSEPVNAPLAQFNSAAEIEANYTWPQADWWDYSVLPAKITGQEHRPIRGGYCEPFLHYCLLRGMEQAFVDLVAEPEIVDYILDKLFGLAYESIRRTFEAIPGQVMFSYVAEDLGSQHGLLMSRAHMQRYLFPRMKRVIDLVHQGGAYVFHHDDGAIREIIPDLIELGIDILNPIQWKLPGMDREGLKRDFGARLIFHGAVDNQYTLPFGSVAEVRQEVAENLQILGAVGGYVLGPCHNIQAVSSPENIIALYETGYDLGWR